MLQNCFTEDSVKTDGTDMLPLQLLHCCSFYLSLDVNIYVVRKVQLNHWWLQLIQKSLKRLFEQSWEILMSRKVFVTYISTA